MGSCVQCPASMCPLIAPNGSPWTGQYGAPCPDVCPSGCAGPHSADRSEAMSRWNSIHVRPSPVEAVERAREALTRMLDVVNPEDGVVAAPRMSDVVEARSALSLLRPEADTEGGAGDA